MKLRLDHIVISVEDLAASISFYEIFLGKAEVTKWDAFWKIGSIRLFLTHRYRKSPKAFDKHNLGLNHLALAVESRTELEAKAQLLDRYDVKHSPIIKDQYSNNLLIWFDDPDGIRIEFYLRSGIKRKKQK